MFKYIIHYSADDGSYRTKRGSCNSPEVDDILALQQLHVQDTWNDIRISYPDGELHSTYEREGCDAYDYICTNG